MHTNSKTTEYNNSIITPSSATQNATSKLQSVSDKRSHFYHFYFYDNFGKCGPMSVILSLLHLAINCEKGRSKRCHLTSYLLPHHLIGKKSSGFFLSGTQCTVLYCY